MVAKPGESNAQDQASDIEFFVLRQVKVQAKEKQSQVDAGEEKSSTEKVGDMTEKLLDEESAAKPSAAATEDKWLSVRLSNRRDNVRGIPEATVTLQWVADVGDLGNLHLADQNDTYYLHINDKRVPSCLCFSKTVAGLIAPEPGIAPAISPNDLFEKDGVTMPTDTAPTVSRNVSLSAPAPALEAN